MAYSWSNYENTDIRSSLAIASSATSAIKNTDPSGNKKCQTGVSLPLLVLSDKVANSCRLILCNVDYRKSLGLFIKCQNPVPKYGKNAPFTHFKIVFFLQLVVVSLIDVVCCFYRQHISGTFCLCPYMTVAVSSFSSRLTCIYEKPKHDLKTFVFVGFILLIFLFIVLA